MLSIHLTANNLGERHKQLNTSVNEAFTKLESLDLHKHAEESTDTDRLFKLELAIKYKNVDFIIENLKSDDMLYSSRAVKATWLIAEDKYANVINPEYLYNSLYPLMHSKAVSKLKSSIRQHLRSEERCEKFYNYLCNELDDQEGALAFLPYCSKEFIRTIIDNLPILSIEFYIADHYSKFNRKAATLFVLKDMFKRICERFVDLAEPILKKVPATTAEHLLTVLEFIAISHLELYMYLLEEYGRPYSRFPKFSASLTAVIAKKKHERILERLDVYIDRLRLHHIKKFWTKELYYAFIEAIQAKSETDSKAKEWFNYHKLRYTVASQEEQTEIYKKYFAKKFEEEVIDKSRDQYIFKTRNNGESYIEAGCIYSWYKRFSFETSFAEMRPLIKASKSPEDRSIIVLTYPSLAKTEIEVQNIVQYYFKFHMNEQQMFKVRFVSALIKDKCVFRFNDESWKPTNDLFTSLGLYADANYPDCIETIVLHNILHDKEVSNEIQTKFFGNSGFIGLINKLTEIEHVRVFDYLSKSLEAECRLYSEECTSLDNYSYWVTTYISLVECWKKCIIEFPTIIQGLEHIFKIKPQLFPHHIQYVYCVAIVCHHLINAKPIPNDIMTNYLTFGYSNKVAGMSEENKVKTFNCLVKDFEDRSTDMINQEDGIKSVHIVELTKKFIQFLRDCKKPSHEYPYLISTIQKIVRAQPNSLQYPYRWEKQTRKLLFNVSILMVPYEETIINVLKHDAALIQDHFENLTSLMKRKGVYVKFLRKLVTYFSNDLGIEFQNFYKLLLKECENDSANVEHMGSNLPLILKKQAYIEVIREYLPSNHKVKWDEEDAWIISIRKNLALNIYRVRPTIDMEILYEFAKGDYLQNALPSLLSVGMALPKQVFSDTVLPRLLNSPVSVQKHGVRLAFRKLSLEIVNKVLKNMWSESKNVSIRNTVFEITCTLLAKQVKDCNIKVLWELVENFATNLREDEERTILTYYHAHLKSLPKSIRWKSCQICYRQMERIKDKIDWVEVRNSLMNYMQQWFTEIEPDFAYNVLLESFKELYNSDNFERNSEEFRKLLMKYLTPREDQNKRYVTVAKPIFSIIIDDWNYRSGRKVETAFDQILKSFTEVCRKGLKFDGDERHNKMSVFTYMSDQFQSVCRVEKNFAYYLKMKLMVIFNEALVETNSTENLEFYKECGGNFSRKCGLFLIDLVTSNFTSIWLPFSAIVQGFSKQILSNTTMLQRGTFLLSFIDNLVSNDAPANNYLCGLYFFIRLDIDVDRFERESGGYYQKVISKIKAIDNKEIQFHIHSKLL